MKPVPGDSHYTFYRHLLDGGTVHRKDDLNCIECDITFADLDGDATKITRVGYKDLTVVPIPTPSQPSERRDL